MHPFVIAVHFLFKRFFGFPQWLVTILVRFAKNKVFLNKIKIFVCWLITHNSGADNIYNFNAVVYASVRVFLFGQKSTLTNATKNFADADLADFYNKKKNFRKLYWEN